MISKAADVIRGRPDGPGRRRSLPRLLVALLAGASAAIIPQSALCDESESESANSSFLRFDSVQSTASFKVRVLLMFTVDGQFGSVSGGVHVDGEQARVEAAIDANAVTMNREANEKWVKSAEFFDVARHPQIFFDSLPFPLARLREGGTLPGTLNMRGVRRSVVFELQPADCEAPAVDCPVEAKGTVRRSEFGMTTRRGALSDKVELEFSVRVVAPVDSPATP
ncbi:YceI family protein [Dokdonella sp.]|uniref:YceI family protein n=1 Tax=Dokdonella sp. TaxID=2291710 RepID=UPI003C5E5792